MTYTTTNIRLEADVYRRLKLRSAQARKSLSQLIREAVDHAYGTRQRGTVASARLHRSDSLFQTVGLCRTGIRDGAAEHDREIYGPRRRA
jgi:hypothetical protein